jgi:hypothetical protein
MTSKSAATKLHSKASSGGSVADEVEQTVRRHPLVETLIRQGWFAKGLVYLLMGVVAATFVFLPRVQDQASPEGALGLVSRQPGGRVLLAVLGLGLMMYTAWRVLSVTVIRGRTTKDHLQRLGYSFSGLFYAFLAYTAIRHALRGSEPNDSYSVERMSLSLMSHSWGRVVLVVVAVVVIGIAAYFIRKSVTGEYVGNLQGIGPTLSANHGQQRLVFVAGKIGWFGRGLVTGLVGFFIARSALRFDAADASGFDKTLRRVAAGDLGSLFVMIAAGGLIAYGFYCLVSAPRRKIAENTA